MKIKYLGHSSFFIQGSDKTVVTDPFKNIGYEMERVSCDFVTVSHGHFDHNNTQGVNYKKAITKTGDGFFAVESYHDASLGALRGKNTVFKFSVDGIVFCHLGDIGEYYSQDFAEELGHIDVLFVPIGGNYTIDKKEALRYIEGINPSVVIPMHYKTPHSKIDIDGVDGFMKIIPNVNKVSGVLTLDKNDLPEIRTVYVFEGENL